MSSNKFLTATVLQIQKWFDPPKDPPKTDFGFKTSRNLSIPCKFTFLGTFFVITR